MNTPRGGVGSVAVGVNGLKNQQDFWCFLPVLTDVCPPLLELRVCSWRKRWGGFTVQRGKVQPPPQQVGGGLRNGSAARWERSQQTQRLPLRRG